MNQGEGVVEAQKRWGESGAVYVRSGQAVRYEVGYFEKGKDWLIFHILGSGPTLEQAFAAADMSGSTTHA